MGLVRLVKLMPILATVAREAGGTTPDEYVSDQGLTLGSEYSASEVKATLMTAIQDKRYHPSEASERGEEHEYIAELKGGCSLTVLLERNNERKLRKVNMALMVIEDADDLVHLLGDECCKAVFQDSRSEALQSLPPWGLDMIDGTYFDNQYTHSLNGSGVDVFVLDTGIDPNHDQLSGRVGTGFDFTGSGSTADANGHGTHCAGTIAGETVGVAPAARVIPMKVFNDAGYGYTSWVVNAVNKVIEIKEARGLSDPPMVISYSGGSSKNTASNDAFAAAVTAGIVSVVAAGNNAGDASTRSPASEPSVLTVGALKDNELPASWSNYGSLIDMWAPGQDVLSADANTGSGLKYLSGTSMACPHVSGVVALMLEAYPLWNPETVESNLKAECSADAGMIQGVASIQLRTYADNSSSLCAASGNEVPCDNSEWSQCGGLLFTGSTCCPQYHSCVVVDEYYSQCHYHAELELETCSNGRWHKCGGVDFSGSNCCPIGWTCIFKDDWYSQCLEVV